MQNLHSLAGWGGRETIVTAFYPTNLSAVNRFFIAFRRFLLLINPKSNWPPSCTIRLSLGHFFRNE
jgi:hypothetical protein